VSANGEEMHQSNKGLVTQVIEVNIWTKHIQYHMQMIVVKILYSVIAVIP